uniref:Uncharacterized protein n=1 Tax=Arundo donax TaxID=35708 RepID=A0A0A8Z4R6_ARUDO
MDPDGCDQESAVRPWISASPFDSHFCTRRLETLQADDLIFAGSFGARCLAGYRFAAL